MPHIETKQLIAGFLLIGTVVGSFSFFLSLAPPQTTAPDTARGPVSGNVPLNAFVEPLRSVPRETPSSGSFQDADVPLPKDNLTQNLLVSLGKKLDEANPNGVAVGGDVDLPINAPSADAVVSDLIAQRLAATDIPDWEAEANNQRIIVLTKYTTADINTYNKNINALVAQYMGAGGDGDTSAVLNSNFSEAQRKGALTLVPEPLAGFHWSLMKLFFYQQKATELTRLADTDPMRAAVIAQAQQQNYFSAIRLLQFESQKSTDIRGLSTAEQNRFVATLNSLFGVKTAHAFWISVDPVKLARAVWEFAQLLITEKLKDYLTHMLVQQTIRWVQGGGKPQFVTDWKQFLKDSGKRAADLAIDELYPQLCQPFAPLIRIALLPVDPSDQLEGPVYCTLDRVVGNVRAFADSFENGGWIAYGAALQPSNNFFGALIETNDILQRERAEAEHAAENDAGASSGYRSSQECVKWEDTPPVPQGITPLTPRCLEYRNTTPGDALAKSIEKAMGAPLDRIVNAKDFVALANALINAALSKLVQLGQDSVSRGLLGLNMSTYDTSGAVCEGLTGADLTACQNGWQPVECTETTVTAPIDGTVDIPPSCTTDEFGVETCTGGGPTPIDGTVTLPNAGTCTGGTTPPGTTPPAGDQACNNENCNPDSCLCKVRDQITPNDFCFLGDIQAGIAAVVNDWRVNSPNGEYDPSTGLIGAPVRGCPGNSTRVCIQDTSGDHEKFKDAVVAKVSGAYKFGAEICITGPSCKQTCSYGSPASCDARLTHTAGEACIGGPRRECSKVDSSQNTIMYNNPNSICPA